MALTKVQSVARDGSSKSLSSQPLSDTQFNIAGHQVSLLSVPLAGHYQRKPHKAAVHCPEILEVPRHELDATLDAVTRQKRWRLQHPREAWMLTSQVLNCQDIS